MSVKKILLIIVILIQAACSTVQNVEVSQLTFVVTDLANITTEDGTARYMMRYKLADDAPENFYGVIHYQDLGNDRIVHTSSIGSIGDVKIINFNSTPVEQIINKQRFEVTLFLYDDPEYKQLVGSHQDSIWFDMPKAVADVLNIKLL
jgi:hypothetical protein